MPQDDCKRFGYQREDFDRRVTNAAFLDLMRFQVDRARDFLQAGLPLAALMPGSLQVDVDLFVRGGLKILDRIAGIGYGVWDTRPVVTRWDVAGLFCGCVGRGIPLRVSDRRVGLIPPSRPSRRLHEGSWTLRQSVLAWAPPDAPAGSSASPGLPVGRRPVAASQSPPK